MLTNMVTSIEHHVEWITELLVDDARRRRAARVEADADAQDEWADHVTGLGRPDAGRTSRATPGTSAPTCPARRGCTCRTPAGSTSTWSAVRSSPRAIPGSAAPDQGSTSSAVDGADQGPRPRATPPTRAMTARRRRGACGLAGSATEAVSRCSERSNLGQSLAAWSSSQQTAASQPPDASPRSRARRRRDRRRSRPTPGRGRRRRRGPHPIDQHSRSAACARCREGRRRRRMFGRPQARPRRSASATPSGTSRQGRSSSRYRRARDRSRIASPGARPPLVDR